MLFGKFAVKVVACAVVSALLLTAQFGYRAVAQNSATNSNTQTPEGPACYEGNIEVQDYDKAAYAIHGVYDINLVDGSTGSPVIRRWYPFFVHVEGTQGYSVIATPNGVRVYELPAYSSRKVAVKNIDGTDALKRRVFTVEYNGDVISLEQDQQDLDDFKILKVMDKQQLRDSSVTEVTVEQLTAPVAPGSDTPWFTDDLVVQPEGLLSLATPTRDVREASLMFFPRNPDGTYGEFKKLGVLEHEGNPWDPARMFYRLGILFLVDANGELYNLDGEGLRAYMNEDDPTRVIEVQKYKHQYAELLGKEWSANYTHILGCVNYLVHTSMLDSSFAQDRDATGAPIPNMYSASFAMEIENRFNQEVSGYRVLYKPVFDENLFQIESISWVETGGAFSGSIPGPITNGVEIDLAANSTGDTMLAGDTMKTIEVTVKYRQIAEDPGCVLEGVTVVPEACISNTVITPGKILSRAGRNIVALPGLTPDPVPVPADSAPGDQPGTAGAADQPDPTQADDQVDSSSDKQDDSLTPPALGGAVVSTGVGDRTVSGRGRIGAAVPDDLGVDVGLDIQAGKLKISDFADLGSVNGGLGANSADAVNPGVAGDEHGSRSVGAVTGVDDRQAKTGAGLAETGGVAPAGGLLGVGVVVLLGAGILLTTAGRRNSRAV